MLEMARSVHADRVAIGGRADGLTFERLHELALHGAERIRRTGSRSVVFVGVNGPAWPVCMYAAAATGVPVAPLNYRLSSERLGALAARLPEPLVIADDRYLSALREGGVTDVVESRSWLRSLEEVDDDPSPRDDGDDPDAPAVILFTSGTTSEPKGVVLRHAHLSAYVVQTVDFGSAGAGDAALVSVPPYHVAGVGTILTNVYAGRRLTYLPDFTPADWLRLVRDEGITQAMLVPTMLARIMDEVDDGQPVEVPTLRSIAYGGAPMPRPVLVRALDAFPATGFVNSYGLTETSSTIAVLGPDEHREAHASHDPVVVARLGSVGRPVPGIEAVVRADDGTELPTGELGELWVRGAQVSAEYMEQGTSADADGWFATRDQAYVDREGYLYIVGRADDTIIRGGENIAPAEIESVLRQHPEVADVGVVGRPDEEWGQRIVAAIVPARGATLDTGQVRAWAREHLRGSRTPDDVVLVQDLPYSPLGKLVRRDLEKALATLMDAEDRS